MTKKEKDLLSRIQKLHSEIIKNTKNSLNRAIRLGTILDTQKKNLGHGNFTRWANSSLPFSERTGQRYMSVFHHKDDIKQANITSLYEAYKLLSNYGSYAMTRKREEMKQRRRDFAAQETKFQNPRTWENKVICGDCLSIMEKMIKKMSGKYSCVITSPPYNANFDYGKKYNDSLPYEDYLEWLLKPFPYYSKLLRTGGRVIYNIGAMVQNNNRNEGGDYNHQLITDLTYRVRNDFPEFKHLTTYIWDKGNKGKNPLNCRWGSFCSPESPVSRINHEYIVIWCKDSFILENETGGEIDITEDEFKEWTWSIWTITSNNVGIHPCTYPRELVKRLIKLYTYKNDFVLDPFSGIGTTGIVAQSLKRKYTCIEINPNYCQEAKKKLKD